MAEYGEWNRKGATLSDVTAKAEYGVDRDVIVKGIQTGKLEYREGSVWGNPYLRVLRSQLEQYLAEELGEDYLRRVKHHTELRRVKKAVADLKKQPDFSVVLFRPYFMLASEKHPMKAHKNQQLLAMLCPPDSLMEP